MKWGKYFGTEEVLTYRYVRVCVHVHVVCTSASLHVQLYQSSIWDKQFTCSGKASNF